MSEDKSWLFSQRSSLSEVWAAGVSGSGLHPRGKASSALCGASCPKEEGSASVC